MQMAKTGFQIPFCTEWKREIIIQTLKANKQISRPKNFTGFIFSQYFLKSNKPVVEKIIVGLKMSF